MLCLAVDTATMEVDQSSSENRYESDTFVSDGVAATTSKKGDACTAFYSTCILYFICLCVGVNQFTTSTPKRKRMCELDKLAVKKNSLTRISTCFRMSSKEGERLQP